MKEAAEHVKEVAKAELQQNEEELVASTRETDLLLNDYKYLRIFHLPILIRNSLFTKNE